MKTFELGGATLSLALFLDVSNSKYALLLHHFSVFSSSISYAYTLLFAFEDMISHSILFSYEEDFFPAFNAYTTITSVLTSLTLPCA